MEKTYSHKYDDKKGIVVTKLNHVNNLSKWKGALFLDRDGVVIEEKEYLSCPNKVQLIKGSANIISKATRNGWHVAIITNQSGIAREYFNIGQYIQVTKRMLLLLAAEDSYVHMITACPFHKYGKRTDFTHYNHPMRKPNPGMIEFIAKEIGLEQNSRSILVGDKICDLEAGINYGIDTVVHVYTGHGRTHRKFIEQKFKDCREELLLIDSIADLSTFKDFGIS